MADTQETTQETPQQGRQGQQGLKQAPSGPGQITLDQAQVERGDARPGGVEADPNGNEVTILKVGREHQTFSDPKDAVKAIRSARARAYGAEEVRDRPPTPRIRTGEPPKLNFRGLESSAPEEAPTAPPPQAASDAPPQEEPVEPTEPSEAAEPPLAPPQSWTQEEKDEFKTYPRNAQEALLRREQDRQRQFTLRQQELAESRRRTEAAEAEANRKRDEYEARVAQNAQALTAQLAAAYPDIKTQEDLDRLAAENPPRFNSYLLASMRANNVTAEAQALENQRNTRLTEESRKWAKEQDRLFAERVPDFKDEMRQKTRPYLESVGFTMEEIDHHWNTTGMLRDARAQQLIADALHWRELGSVRKSIEAKAKPVPPVMRPGTARSTGPDPRNDIRALEKQLAQAPTTREQLKISAQLTKARRAAGLLETQ